MVAAILIVVGVVAYVIGIFVYDVRRRKQGKPSIFLDVCESEGKGRRLVKTYRKANRR